MSEIPAAAQPPPEFEHYAGERLRQALTADPRVSDLSLQVHIVASNVFVTGQVPTQERLDAVFDVALEVLPDHVLHNDVSVISLSEVASEEHIS